MRRILFLVLLCSSLAIAQEIKRPTADVDDSSDALCSQNFDGSAHPGAIYVASSAMPNAYDTTNPPPNATSSVQTLSDSTSAFKYSARTFQTWQTGSTYASLTVNVSWSCSLTLSTGGAGACAVAYYDGSAWTTLLKTWSARAQTTDTVTITPTQALSTLKFRVCTHVGDEIAGGTNTATATVWDIWTSGVLASASSPNINVILLGDARRKER